MRHPHDIWLAGRSLSEGTNFVYLITVNAYFPPFVFIWTVPFIAKLLAVLYNTIPVKLVVIHLVVQQADQASICICFLSVLNSARV
jgi:hypothetical protein